MTNLLSVSRLRMRLLPLVFLLVGPSIFGQNGPHVYYNLFTDSVWYQRDGKDVRQPKIRKGDRVVVHFTEFNPFLYQAEVTATNENRLAASGGEGLSSLGAFSGLMPGIGSFMPGFLGGAPADSSESAGGLLSFFQKPLLSLGSKSFALKDLFSGSRGADITLMQARERLEEMAGLQTEMETIYTEIQAMKKAETTARLADTFFETVVLNPNLRPSSIQKMGNEYFNLLYRGKKPTEVGLEDAFAWQNRFSEKQELVQELTAKQAEFAEKSGQLTPLANQLANLELHDAGLDQFTADLRAQTKTAQNFQKQVARFTASQKMKSTTDESSLEKILAQQIRFRELSEQPFSHETVVLMESDLVILTAAFSPLDTLKTGQRPPRNSLKTKTLKLETSGGLRISSGFGMAFGGFATPMADFTVRNGVIVADAGSPVQPTLASFIHFYSDSKKGTSVAGSFGIGIPLGGGGDFQAIHFFIGPSLLFGRGQRVVFTGGLMLGPAQRLAKGYAEGDAFDLNLGDIPTRRNFEAGWFAGLSFNLTGGQ